MTRRRGAASSRRPPTSLRAAIGLFIALSTSASGEARAQLRAALNIPPGCEADILGLLLPDGMGREIAGGYGVQGLEIDARRFAFVLRAAEGLAPREVRVRLTLGTEGVIDLLRGGHPYSLTVEPDGEALPPGARAAAAIVKQRIEKNADAGFWRRLREKGQAVPGAPGVAPLVPGGDPRERRYAEVALLAALAALFVLLGAALNRIRRGLPPGARPMALDAALVLGVSLLVRFGLTTTNILTDGASGYGRLLSYRPGFGGLFLLIDLLLPASRFRFMETAIQFPRLLSALSPPLLVIVARGLGLDRRGAILAGLALAALPLHAAMFTSDFLGGSLITLELLALALLLGARHFLRADLFAGGCAVLAYAVWGRPESPILLLPAAVVVLASPRRLLLRAPTAAGALWLSGSVAARLITLRAIQAVPSRGSAAGPWGLVPFGEALTSSAILPFWLWIPAPLGLLRLSWEGRAVALAGLATGLLPAHLGVTAVDPSGGYLEVFRYGAGALPWLALLSGAGLSLVADALAAILARWVDRDGTQAARAIAGLPFAAFAGWLLITPILERGYLATRYGNGAEEEVFLRALHRVPPACGLLVPDDESVVDDTSRAWTTEIDARFRSIVEEAQARGGESLPSSRVVGITRFLRAVKARGALPPVAELEEARDNGATPPPPETPCWYYFRGAFCSHGLLGAPPAACVEMDARLTQRPVERYPIRYRSHRLLARPRAVARPFHDPDLSLELREVTGVTGTVLKN